MGLFRLIALTVLLIALALGGAACSGDDDSDAGSTSARTTDGRAGEPAGGGGEKDEDAEPIEASLEFRLERIGSKGGGGVPVPQRASCTKSIPASCTGKLVCPPAKDARQGDAELCDWLATDGREALAPVDDTGRQLCTMIYGGPERASVTGTLDGEPVEQRYSRENGCGIGRWDAVAPLWTGDVAGAETEAPTANGARGAVGNPNAAGPGASGGAEPQREVISDPPEAFER